MGTLTVRENLRFSAALRLPGSVSQREKEVRVNHLLKELGLTKVADSKVDDHKASSHYARFQLDGSCQIIIIIGSSSTSSSRSSSNSIINESKLRFPMCFF